MFRDRVVAHYVNRGYTVEADRLVTGESGMPHRPDLICAGDLGDLVVFFGGEEPLSPPELASFKRAAHDLGAAPIVAVPKPGAALREAARAERIVLLEDASLDDRDEDDDVYIETIQAQWPDEPAQEARMRVAPVGEIPEERVGEFDWLPLDEPKELDDAEAFWTAEPEVAVGSRTTSTPVPLHWVWGPLLYLTATLVLVIVGALLFF